MPRLLSSDAAWHLSAFCCRDSLAVCFGAWLRCLPACRRLNIAGRDITSRLVDLLQLRGYCFGAAADFETVRSIKERACYVATDYQRELQASSFFLFQCLSSTSHCLKAFLTRRNFSLSDRVRDQGARLLRGCRLPAPAAGKPRASISAPKGWSLEARGA